MQPQDLIINIKIALKAISDKSRNENEKARRARAFLWFTGLLEDVMNMSMEIIALYLNQLKIDKQIIKFIEKVFSKEKKAKNLLYIEIINNFNSALPMNAVREQTKEIQAAMSAILVSLQKKDFEKLQEIYNNYTSGNLPNLFKVLSKVNEEMPLPTKIKVYGCDKAINSSNVKNHQSID